MGGGAAGDDLAPADLMREWSARHGGYDADGSALVTGWLRLVHGLARPLTAARVPPDLVTAAGVAAGLVAARSRRPQPAAGWVLLTALLDGLDGAVAIRRSLAEGSAPSRHGARLDRLADRVTDCCFAVALSRAGAPSRLVAAGLAGTAVHEWVAARARADGPVAVTPGERPLRVAYVVGGLIVSPRLGATAVAVTTGLGVVMMRRK